MTHFISDRLFKGLDFSEKRLPKAEYENCVFKGCDFSNGYLDNQNFIECRFLDCNLSNANIAHTQFNEVEFDHCKMMGLKFEGSNNFLMDFTFKNAILNLSSFIGLSLKKKHFKECKLIEVDFTETDLSHVKFEKCDLERAIFHKSILEGSDFTSAYNFNIDPETNRLKGALFTLNELPNLLQKHQLKIMD